MEATPFLRVSPTKRWTQGSAASGISNSPLKVLIKWKKTKPWYCFCPQIPLYSQFIFSDFLIRFTDLDESLVGIRWNSLVREVITITINMDYLLLFVSVSVSVSSCVCV